jgi:hypothetical protein
MNKTIIGDVGIWSDSKQHAHPSGWIRNLKRMTYEEAARGAECMNGQHYDWHYTAMIRFTASD